MPDLDHLRRLSEEAEGRPLATVEAMRFAVHSMAIVRALLAPDALEKMARAYDREDAAQMGEPDPWSVPFEGDRAADAVWVSERIACMQAALAALLEVVDL